MYGPARTISRTAPAIHNDTIYLTNSLFSNIGPQLYAIDKYTGTLKWAIGYYPPNEYLVDHPGSKVVRTKDNYSNYIGSNVRLSDMNLIVIERQGKELIFAGVSSLQNAINPGVIPGNSHYNSYPYFADQGFLFCIENIDATGEIKWQLPLCAPELTVGQQLVKSNGDPELAKFDPFPPGQNYVAVATYTTTAYVSPYIFGASDPNPNTNSIAQRVSITPSTVINSSLVWTFWQSLGAQIFIDASTNPLNLTQILASWGQKQALGQPFVSTIYTFLDATQISQAQSTPVTGQFPLFYLKQLNNGDVITSKFDAMGLNYYGNSTWGAPCSIVDDVIYFGTGQAHSAPFSELQYFAKPSKAYRKLKIPVVDAISAFQAAPSSTTLAAANNAKSNFEQTIIDLSVEVSRSPRGQMSYSDAIIGASVDTGRMLFGVRTVPADTYTFLGGTNPVSLVYPNINTIDGDPASGIHFIKKQHREYVATTTKSGSGPILDITDLNPNAIFNHTNPSDVGVTYLASLYLGSNNSSGASNYQCAVDKSDAIICCQSNISAAYNDGTIGSVGQFEKFVTSSGHFIPDANSYLASINVDTQQVNWYTEFQNFSMNEPTICNECIFCADSVGSLYAFDVANGELLWKYGAKTADTPMNGGISSACVGDGQVFWISSYTLPGVANSPGSQYGMCFKLNKDIYIKPNHRTTYKFAKDSLVDNDFKSWDSYPKIPNPPSPLLKSNDTVTHSWRLTNGAVYVDAIHTTLTPATTISATLQLKNEDFENNILTFDTQTTDLIYLDIKMINTLTYVLHYKTFDSVTMTWSETKFAYLYIQA